MKLDKGGGVTEAVDTGASKKKTTAVTEENEKEREQPLTFFYLLDISLIAKCMVYV